MEAVAADPQRFGSLGATTDSVSFSKRDGVLYFQRAKGLFPIAAELYDADVKVAAMDRMRIDISVLSVAPPTYFYDISAEAGLALARLSNQGIADMVTQHPDRLRGMGTLPMQDVDAAITELERICKDYPFKGVELGTSINGQLLSEEKFRPVLKTAEQLGCYVLAHPFGCAAKGGMEGYELFNTIGNPLDETMMVAQLMFSGAMDEMKSLRMIIPHGGGYLPYQIGRFECAHTHRPAVNVDTKTSPRTLLRRFYFDALTHDPKSTRLLIDTVGADHMVLGTDNPFDMGYPDPLAALDATPGLTPQEKNMICSGTALSLLGEGPGDKPAAR